MSKLVESHSLTSSVVHIWVLWFVISAEQGWGFFLIVVFMPVFLFLNSLERKKKKKAL